MNITNFFPVFYPLSADDTEYGYHSASSSSAEHHAAQLGPVQHPQQQHQQQQNYIQGQNQSHVSTYWISHSLSWYNLVQLVPNWSMILAPEYKQFVLGKELYTIE